MWIFLNFQFDPIKREFPLPLPCMLAGLRYLYFPFVWVSLSYTYRSRYIVLHALFYSPLVFMGDDSLLTTSVKENLSLEDAAMSAVIQMQSDSYTLRHSSVHNIPFFLACTLSSSSFIGITHSTIIMS